jgi:hypothetical protein
MPESTSAIPPLAGAFLALTDDAEPPAPRSARRAAAAALATLALAVSAPAAWAAPAPQHRSRELPAATLTSKSSPAALAADDDAG